MRRARAHVWRRPILGMLGVASLSGACRGSYPEGRLVCESQLDCPAHWSCDARSGPLRCYASALSTTMSGAASTELPSTGSGGTAAASGGAGAGHAGAQMSAARSGASGAVVPAPPTAATGGAGVAGSAGAPTAATGGMAGSLSAGAAADSAGTNTKPQVLASAGNTAGAAAPDACADAIFCYGFEAGVLDPGRVLSPTSNMTGTLAVSTRGQLTTLEYPAGSMNHVLVSTPSTDDALSKATVGFSPQQLFTKLRVSFDFARAPSLQSPALKISLFRLTAVTGTAYVRSEVLLLGNKLLVAHERGSTTPPTVTSGTISETTPTAELRSIAFMFDRTGTPQCAVTAAYNGGPAKALVAACDLNPNWSLEFGLNVPVPEGTTYTEDYAAYYDNIVVTLTQ